MTDVTREELLEAVKALAKKREQASVSKADFKQETGYGIHDIQKYWDTWTEFLQSAGLEPPVNKRIEQSDLLLAAKEVFLEQKGIPTSIRFSRLSKYSIGTYMRRWHTYAGFLSAFKEWVKQADPTFPYLELLNDAPAQQATQSGLEIETHVQTEKSWPSHTGKTYGSFLNFRGLQHAPINEQGVVFLFGMIAFELGYVVESIATGFPDCEAKRRTSISRDTWERVRIEFEYESRNFVEHGHNIAGCDVIVCWTHNWNECPIEVLELSSAIQDLGDDA